MKRLACGLLAVVWSAPLAAQTGGVLTGTVRDSATGAKLQGVSVIVRDQRREVATDSGGLYRFRDLHSGWHNVVFRLVGYRVVVRESVLVRAGLTTELAVALLPATVELSALLVSSPVDPVLDPLTPATTQRVSAEELRSLPVSTVDEAVALSAGAVGESYRGGRIGQQAFVLDGLGVKNQLDASTGGLGVRVPPDMLTEASLVTNGFSARYGQALSGLVNVVTKDGGADWSGRAAYESDRLAPNAWDYGFDRLVVSGDGPLAGGIRLVAAMDVQARIDADPVNAPAPTDPHDPRTARSNLLPHNGGEQADLAAKLTIPLGGAHTFRLFGLRSVDQRELFDPALKYDQRYAPARRSVGNLGSVHWQFTPAPAFGADLRVAYFDRDFVRGQLVNDPSFSFGAFTSDRFSFVGEALARAQDTAAARNPVAGFGTPQLADLTPWGVPAFFLSDGGRGDIAWSHFSELRTQVDLNISGGRYTDWYVGGELVRQSVRTFQRVQGYDAVGTRTVPPAPATPYFVPPATAASFKPVSGAAYVEAQARWQDIAVTVGARYDRFNPRSRTGGTLAKRSRGALSPRFGVSTLLAGATVVASYGHFAQAPDFQYLTDAAFDDTARTGRFRAGNPSLGFETASQFEFSVRARPRPLVSLRVNAFHKRLEGLVASVPLGLDPDSTVFGNADFGTVVGSEIILEREMHAGWAARIAYTLQSAQATATNAYQLLRRIRVAPGAADTIFPASVEYPLDYDRRHSLIAILQGRLTSRAGPRTHYESVSLLEVAAVIRWSSGLPYSRTNAAGDSLIDLPNSFRLPNQSTVDVLLRRPLRLGGVTGSVYFDARNLLNRRNIVAVRRDTGSPGLGSSGITAAAQAAFTQHPEAIPYESRRYRAWADTDHNGLIEGAGELLPLFTSAARDFYQALFAYGPPRTVRLGMEVVF